MATTRAVVVDAADGEALWFGGGLAHFKVTSAQSNGAYIVFEDTMPRGKTTPLHVHPTFDETIFVVSGELLVHVDGDEHTVGAGGIASIPRGVVHAFIVTSEEAQTVAFVTPGDVAERFFRTGGDPVTGRESAPPPLDIEKVKRAGEQTGGMTVLGPPPFAMVKR
jgi:quercetin dioxygenase-like cupin family protein